VPDSANEVCYCNHSCNMLKLFELCNLKLLNTIASIPICAKCLNEKGGTEENE
jgi:hypothetical protein